MRSEREGGREERQLNAFFIIYMIWKKNIVVYAELI